MDLGVVLAESSAADVVQKIFDLPVPSDPGGELGTGRRAGRQAGDQVDAFDGESAGGEVLSPAHDLEGLAGVGAVDVSEDDGLQTPDLQAVVGSGAVVVVERDLTPGQVADAVEQAGVVGLDLGDVVGTAFTKVDAVGVLRVQGVGCDDRAGQVDGVQQGLEGGGSRCSCR